MNTRFVKREVQKDNFGKVIETGAIDKVKGLYRRLERAKLSYIVELTGNTETIVVEATDTKYIISDSFLSFKSLGFITQVKKHAKKTGKEKQPFESKDINYYKISHQDRQGTFYDVCEVDVNGAYWEIAKRLGYIDEKIYKKGLTVDKKTRLIALGALATVKRCIEYRYNLKTNKYDAKYLHDKKDEVTRSYFFHIAKTLDNLMSGFISENGMQGIYLYWVDAFFVDNYRAKELVDFFEKHNLKVKTKIIRSMNCRVKKGERKIIAIEEKEQFQTHTEIRIKPFFEIDALRRKKEAVKEFKRLVTKNYSYEK